MSQFNIGSSILLLILISTLSLSRAYGVDIVKMNTGGLSNDFRAKYRATVLEAALEATIEEFGPYEIKIIELPTPPTRAIHKKNLHKFAKVSTLDDLKRLARGVRSGWATTKILKDSGLSTFELTTLNGLYNMLDNDAIDYIPRGINEIYGEIEMS
ncbi:hypothetical protein J3L16_10455 [Alteromonas sp. 5E99-2]|uniref:hypothetical protein n=1 Tax=Alteromonas sp. 5E99-2 TaxID=2817683 RepID=UPI001A998543|nr:hypothetical protein [Alteromonas sp. 5E99-2]MBO1256106.1 hypothetical protein [Alteromonas sp. 5E99-2]